MFSISVFALLHFKTYEDKLLIENQISVAFGLIHIRFKVILLDLTNDTRQKSNQKTPCFLLFFPYPTMYLVFDHNQKHVASKARFFIRSNLISKITLTITETHFNYKQRILEPFLAVTNLIEFINLKEINFRQIVNGN